MEDKNNLAALYARARELQMEAWSDEIIRDANDSSQDTITIEKNGREIEVENREWINRSRLRIDTKKWLMTKLFSKRYGDKLEQHTIHDVGPSLATVQDDIRKGKTRPASHAKRTS